MKFSLNFPTNLHGTLHSSTWLRYFIFVCVILLLTRCLAVTTVSDILKLTHAILACRAPFTLMKLC